MPVSNLDTQWISPFSQTGPSTSEAANQVGISHLKAARGEVAFDYDLVNLDMGQTVNFGSSTQVSTNVPPPGRKSKPAKALPANGAAGTRTQDQRIKSPML